MKTLKAEELYKFASLSSPQAVCGVVIRMLIVKKEDGTSRRNLILDNYHIEHVDAQVWRLMPGN